jgi:hypothetical protein
MESNLPVVKEIALPSLGVEEVIAGVRKIHQVMGEVMHDGEHYGLIPGCGDKKVLYKAGAEKISMTFQFSSEYKVQKESLGGDHREYEVVCTLKTRNGLFVGEGVGNCNTKETKFRYRVTPPTNTGQPVPKSYWDNRDQQILGGLGFIAKKVDKQWFIFKKSDERIENPDIADTYNTVLKMAKKRAYVDAVITATNCSDIFTQDLEDFENTENANEGQSKPKASDYQQTIKYQDDSNKLASVQERLDKIQVDDWTNVQIHFGNKHKGKTLGSLYYAENNIKALRWLRDDWAPNKKVDTRYPATDDDLRLIKALEKYAVFRVDEKVKEQETQQALFGNEDLDMGKKSSAEMSREMGGFP